VAGAREIIGRRVGVGELADLIRKDTIFYDESGGGVTFSGGEPLMQSEFLHDLLLQCKAQGIHTAVDTCLHTHPMTVDTIADHVDLFLCDLKHMDSEVHEVMTTVGNEQIHENMCRLATAGKRLIPRIPVIPGVNDDERNIEATGRFAASLDGVSRIDILPYHGGGSEKAARLTGTHELLKAEPPSVGRLKGIADRLRAFGLTVRIGG
jgi:pyruvate formate lyase activating enzyme